jgi:hypothetical protein
MNKLDMLKTHYLAGNYAKALAIAARFPRLGNEEHDIVLAHECIAHEAFYKGLKKDTKALVQHGVKQLAAKYHLPAPQFQ